MPVTGAIMCKTWIWLFCQVLPILLLVTMTINWCLNLCENYGNATSHIFAVRVNLTWNTNYPISSLFLFSPPHLLSVRKCRCNYDFDGKLLSSRGKTAHTELQRGEIDKRVSATSLSAATYSILTVRAWQNDCWSEQWNKRGNVWRWKPSWLQFWL